MVLISSRGFDLYSIDPETGERENKVVEDVGSHCMYVTGYTINGDIIVSSWGEKYILDVSVADYYNYKIIDINI